MLTVCLLADWLTCSLAVIYMLFGVPASFIDHDLSVHLPASIQALESHEQEKDRLCLPHQNPSTSPGRMCGSPRSDRTLDLSGTPSPAASTPDLHTTPLASDTPSVNGQPEECRTEEDVAVTEEKREETPPPGIGFEYIYTWRRSNASIA